MENIHKRAEEWCESIINRIDTSDLYRGYIQGAVEERAEFKEYLEGLIVHDIKNQSDAIIAGDRDAPLFYSARIQAYESIIDKLFPNDKAHN